MIIICCIAGPLRRRGGTPKPRQPVAAGYGKHLMSLSDRDKGVA